MVRRILFLTTLLLVVACAEIVPLTGGNKDTFAPKPVAGKQLPEQGAIGWNGNQLTVSFDEYFKLNDPGNTIVMNPSLGELTTVQKNKTLTISWKNELAANTTYILQLNGAVRDLNEGNDSILSFVFSTGLHIDSLHFSGRCSEAFSNELIGNVSIGLYPDSSINLAQKPQYLTRSDGKGIFRFDYLKSGNYQVIGFIDRNKNQRIDNDEPLGFLSELKSTSDTSEIHLKLSTPAVSNKAFNVVIEQPGLARITGKNIDSNTVFINQLPAHILSRYRADSILVALPANTTANYELVCKTDTLLRKLSVDKRAARFTVSTPEKTKRYRSGDTLVFQATEWLQRLDTTKINVTSGTQSLPFTAMIRENQCVIVPQQVAKESFTVHFQQGALNGYANENDSITASYEVFAPDELSNLTIACGTLSGNWIIQLTHDGKIVAQARKSFDQQKVVFHQQYPGQYAVTCIEDHNNNGLWDTGNYTMQQQPERVFRFQLKQKLRANWDVEEVITLE